MAASAAVAAATAMELIEDMKQQMLAVQTDWAAQMSEIRATMTQETQTREDSVRTVEGMINDTIGRVAELETFRVAADYRMGSLEARSGPVAGPPGMAEKEESRLRDVVGGLENRVSSAAARADATFDKHAKRLQDMEEALKSLKGVEETGGEQIPSQEPEPAVKEPEPKPEPTANTETTEEEKEKEDEAGEDEEQDWGKEYREMTIIALRGECRQRGIKVGGSKAELIRRLIDADAAERAQDEEVKS